MQTSKTLTVKTPVYEGPLDLLLELIEKRKLLINDISLSAVAEEYIARINAMEELPVGETAEFVALAATLLLIKSRSLLPLLELSPDETRDIKELEYRLAVYQLIKNAARSLNTALDNPALWEGSLQEPEPLFIPDESVTLESILSASHILIEGFPKNITLPKVSVQKIVTLEEMITSLAQRISVAMRLSFKEFTGKRMKPEIIVSFLALLELVKQGIVKAEQDKGFGDIHLESSTVATPTYE